MHVVEKRSALFLAEGAPILSVTAVDAALDSNCASKRLTGSSAIGQTGSLLAFPIFAARTNIVSKLGQDRAPSGILRKQIVQLRTDRELQGNIASVLTIDKTPQLRPGCPQKPVVVDNILLHKS